MPDTFPFDPDWTEAPAATLDDWMEENDLHLDDLADRVAHGYHPYREAIINQLRTVLAKEPVDADTAVLLHQCTGIPASFWANLERNYREALAAGKADTTHVIRRG